MDYTNERLVSYFMAELKNLARKTSFIYKMDPAVHYQDFHLGEEHQPHAEATAIIETLKEAKYQGLTMDMGPPSSLASKRIFIVKILVRNNCQKVPRK